MRVEGAIWVGRSVKRVEVVCIALYQLETFEEFRNGCLGATLDVVSQDDRRARCSPAFRGRCPQRAETERGRGETSHFVAAYFHPSGGDESLLTLFPMAPVKAVDVNLPQGMSSYYLVSFGPDSKSMYLGDPTIDGRDGVTKVEFGPTRKSIVPGLSVAFLTVSHSGRIFVSAGDRRTHQCGAYEIDPDTATHRPIRIGDPPECAGATGPISPDGKEVLSRDGEHLSLLDLNTGATRPLGAGRGSWSPDGRWIAVSGQRQIVLIDAKSPSHRRKLGASGVDDHLVWSPDSKRLLFVKQELRCFLMVYAESLEVVDVETGKRHAISSAHCAVSRSTVGWIDPEAVR